MTRRKRGFFAELQHQRQLQERQQQRFRAEQLRLANQAAREHERAAKAQQRAQAQAVKEQREWQIRQQQADAAELTNAIQTRVAELDALLVNSLTEPGVFSFDQLRQAYQARPFVPDQGLATPGQPPRWEQFAPPPPTGIGRLFKTGHERETMQARARFEYALAQFQARERSRMAALADAGSRHAAEETSRRQQIDQHNAAVDELERGIKAGLPEAV
jgi:restriction system protein